MEDNNAMTCNEQNLREVLGDDVPRDQILACLNAFPTNIERAANFYFEVVSRPDYTAPQAPPPMRINQLPNRMPQIRRSNTTQPRKRRVDEDDLIEEMNKRGYLNVDDEEDESEEGSGDDDDNYEYINDNGELRDCDGYPTRNWETIEEDAMEIEENAFPPQNPEETYQNRLLPDILWNNPLFPIQPQNFPFMNPVVQGLFGGFQNDINAASPMKKHKKQGKKRKNENGEVIIELPSKLPLEATNEMYLGNLVVKGFAKGEDSMDLVTGKRIYPRLSEYNL